MVLRLNPLPDCYRSEFKRTRCGTLLITPWFIFATNVYARCWSI